MPAVGVEKILGRSPNLLILAVEERTAEMTAPAPYLRS